MLTISEEAVEQIKQGLAEADYPYLRIAVQGGGCSGMQYTFDLEDKKLEDDWEIGQVLVDAMSAMYLEGATVNYEDGLMGSAFSINNPSAQTTCGCGSSFAP